MLNVISLKFQNHSIQYEDLTLNDQPEPSDSRITLKTFLQYGERLSREPSVKDPCQKIRHYYEYSMDAIANGYDPTTCVETQNKLWRVVQDLLPSLRGKRPEDVGVDNTFLNAIFSPLIPDSWCLKKAQSKSSSCLMKCAATIALIGEMVIRELGSALVSLALDVYSIYNPDYAAFYKFRLGLNQHRPFHALSHQFFSMIGGYS